jgi:hypothetical protein
MSSMRISDGARLPFRLPTWAPYAALLIGLIVSWANFIGTIKWAALAGALNGWKRPWYATALVAASILTIVKRRSVGREVQLGTVVPVLLLMSGAGMILFALFSVLPVRTWHLIPFQDDWTPLFQEAVNGVHLLRRGVAVGWNWWFLGGYPTSTDVAQNFGALLFAPMAIFGDRAGFHLLHAVFFLCVPVFVWSDLRHDGRQMAIVATGFACLFAAGYFGTLSQSGDTNSMAGVFCAGLSLVGSRHARLGRWWGGPLLLVGLTAALYSHVAFFVYAVLYLALEVLYFRDWPAGLRLAVTVTVALLAALPVHWESLRYPQYVSFNNTVYDPGAPIDWRSVARTIYYNVEILAFPQRWFNDYRSLTNVWMAALLVTALARRTRAGFYAAAALVTQLAMRFSTYELGALPDRMMHMLPMLIAPALAGFVLQFAGTRGLATALVVVLGLYVQVAVTPIRHVDSITEFDPALIEHMAHLDGNMVLVEISPHRSMDRDRRVHSARTPFNVHFEPLLPSVAGQRFYSQMWDGWVWNSFRGEVVGAGTFAGRPIAETPVATFEREMRRWGVRHLLVWTDPSRAYLAASGRFVERWRAGRWSHFELTDADVRSVVMTAGRGELRQLDFLGADVELTDAIQDEPVVVRTRYYPAWQARAGDRMVPLYASEGQLAFRAPAAGNSVVHLEYSRYRWLSIEALIAFVIGIAGLARWRQIPR